MSIEALARALDIDQDFELAYNSLAMTQKYLGEYEKAVHNYDQALKAFTRKGVRSMKNSRDNPIIPFEEIPFQLWIEYASYGSLFAATLEEDIQYLVLPTGEEAVEEERTRKHAGLFWTTAPTRDGALALRVLPNYYNTFCEIIKGNTSYFIPLGNRGTVLKLLGRDDEAEMHFCEARFFRSFCATENGN